MVFQRKYATLLVTGTTAIRVPIIKRGVVDFAVAADWTPAAGDVKIFIDGAAVANVTNLPVAKDTANTGSVWEFILTAAELTGKNIQVVISDAATKAIEDQCFIVETFGNASAMIAQDISLANYAANVTQLLGTAWLTPGVAGTPDVNTKLIGGTASAGAAGKVALDPAQALSNTQTAQTVGDCLVAARAQAVGKWVLSGTTLTLYASDGTTVYRTFTLDSATAPTSRT